MNKYDLAAKITKYTAIVISIYLVGRFGINVYFDSKENKEQALKQGLLYFIKEKKYEVI